MTSQNAPEWAKTYSNLGFRLVKVAPNTKVPVSRNWLNLNQSPDSFATIDNVGLVMGPCSKGLSSVKVACGDDEQRDLAESLFLPITSTIAQDHGTGALFFFFLTKDAPRDVTIEKYGGGSLVELRVKSHYVLAPPSVAKSKSVCWRGRFAPPPEVRFWDIVRLCQSMSAMMAV